MSVGTQRQPSTRPSGKGFLVSHRERFYTVETTTNNLETRTFACNPGLGSMFPWLSTLAMRYEKYKFKDLSFHFTTQAAPGAGTVMMIFDFDANDTAPVDMDQAALSNDYSNGPVWNDQVLRPQISVGDMLPQKLTRPATPGGQYGLNNYDVGQLHIMTRGCGGAALTLGYVEVRYTVELYCHQGQYGIGGRAYASVGLSSVALVGTDMTIDSQAYVPFTFTASGTMTFNQSFEGILVARIVGTALSADLALNGTATGSINHQIVDAGALNVIAVSRVKGKIGQTFVPTITATTVTSIQWYVAPAGYLALG